MNSKSHFYLSLAKSIIRIIGSVWSLLLANNGELEEALMCALALYGGAEALGILEEIWDKRG